MDRFAEFLGKLHPLFLHFPLALLVIGGALEGIRWYRESPFLARTAIWIFALGAITALLSAGSGWLLAGHEHIRGDQKLTLAWHRWLGVGTALVACLAWAASITDTSFGSRSRLRRILGVSAALLVLATGYYGGELVWGRDWFQPSAMND